MRIPLSWLQTLTDIPSDLAVGNIKGGQPKVITTVNADLFANKELGKVEEIWYKSSHDGLDIQGWIMKPPGFDPSKKYELIPWADTILCIFLFLGCLGFKSEYTE